MRDLTEEELKLAPEWACKFDFFNGDLIYMSDVVGDYEGKPLYRFLDVKHNIEEVGVEGDYDLCTRLIVKESFDITKHEWGDTVGYVETCSKEITLNCGTGQNYIELFKDDAIAIAKHFGLTAEDLR